VIPYFLNQSLKNGSIVVHSDGSQTRDYIYVDDVVTALVAASTAPNINGKVINVGSGVETSINELVELVASITGKKLDVIRNTNIFKGVSRMRADISLANQKLNFKPSINLQEGLRLTLQKDPRFNGNG